MALKPYSHEKTIIIFFLTTFSLNLFCQLDTVIVHDSTYSYNWDVETNDWIFESKTVLYWSELKTSVFNVNAELNCNIYPNPVRDIITIETDRFDHYSINIASLNGQFIYGAEVKGTSHQVDLLFLTKGVYLISIRSMDNVITRKIIKL